MTKTISKRQGTWFVEVQGDSPKIRMVGEGHFLIFARMGGPYPLGLVVIQGPNRNTVSTGCLNGWYEYNHRISNQLIQCSLVRPRDYFDCNGMSSL